ncbi:hypothetical protein CHS0354_039074 [Potamilus streckersoni]|uniref:EGF-like domain-containing protein n=1 Tax=Potamilus streckersoni TaxID=2493646 RepID=A0AAE0RRS8_9BIVA|nr:hypothetical protein CHS0354_039074 [Potamilus streckersoni]
MKERMRNINECLNTRLNNCSQIDTCLNTDGDYTCSCSIGFRLENDGRTCTECDQYHYGPNCSASCNCGIGADRCDPIKGCVCREGWGGEKCTLDKNECTAIPSPCHGQNTVCINTNGSFICACATGFKNSSSGCKDINECIDPFWNECDQICINKDGYYTCVCEQGFLKDENSCQDIDECAGQNDCNHFCENTPGGYRCTCEEGFKLNVSDKRTCIRKN